MLPTEFHYALGLLQAAVVGNGSAPPSPDGLDWDRVAGYLATRGLAATVAPIVATRDVPEEFRQRITAQARQLKRYSALFWMETSRVLADFERRGPRAILLKGPAMARTVYPRPEQRLASDLDLLVPRDALDDACGILTDLGYRPAVTGRHISFYEDHHFHLIFRQSSGFLIEVHWDLSRPGDYFRFDLDGFAARARKVEIDGNVVHVPANSDQLLHASCQALKQGFTDLRRLLDAAFLVRGGIGAVAPLVETARRQGMATPLWVLLEQQRNLIGTESAPELHRELRPGAFVRRCLDTLDLPSVLARAGKRGDAGSKHVLNWLCAPRLSRAFVEVGRFVAPGTAEYLEEGYAPEVIPRGFERLRRGARRSLSLVRILGRQGWRLARG